MKTSKSIKRILIGAALFMLFTGLFTACPQKIKDKKISVDGISLDKNELDLGIGESSKLSAAISPANASNKKITWTSDNSGIAEVDQDGNVTGKADGNAVITATTEDGGKTATCTVKVKFIHIDTISLDKNELDLGIGESSKLSITITPANASNKKITWTSDNSGIAEVDQDGNVTGKAEGNAVITATTEDGGETANCNVTVEKGAILILSPDKKDIYIKAVTSSGNITVIGCTQTELTSEVEQTLNATSNRVILKGDIKILYCVFNQLTNLYVQGLNDLEELYCYSNRLTNLDVQGLNNLEKLNCFDNQLTNLDVQGLNNLEELDCGFNQLTSLDVQGSNNLKSLDCSGNQLTSLDVQGLNNLTWLRCYSNRLTNLDVQGLNNLQSLECYSNKLTNLDVQGLNNLQSLECYENQLTNLDVQGLNNLKSLDCGFNQLTSLDVQGLNNLTWLRCYSNRLTSLKVQGLNNLEELYCFDNQLTNLDVQGLNNLKRLDCELNQLTNLNVQGLNNLESLDCKLNQLTNLNVQGSNNLKSLNCGLNQLTKEAFRKLFDDLPARTAEDYARCILYAEIKGIETIGITEGNYKGFTEEELKVIKDKNWKTYKQTGILGGHWPIQEI